MDKIISPKFQMKLVDSIDEINVTDTFFARQ